MIMNILKRSDVVKLTGISYSTIYRLERLDQFPKRRTLSQKRVGWLYSELVDWINSRSSVVQA